MSESVAAEALRDPYAVSLGGDRRYATTLFADVRGYTALVAEQPPEATLDLLNRYLTVVSDAVESEGGTVADLLGDGIFAFFGAPVMHSNDPARAVRAALETGQILIDEATHAVVSDLVRAQDLGSLRLAGKGEWVQAYNVLALA